MKRSNLLLLPFLLGASLLDACKCERVECIRQSDCPRKNQCIDYMCADPNAEAATDSGDDTDADPSESGDGTPDPSGDDTSGGSDPSESGDGTPDPSGGGDPDGGGGCSGFEFEALSVTVSEGNWGCQVEMPDVFLPLDPWTASPRLITQDTEEAQSLHEVAVCRDGCENCAPDDLPTNWAKLADDLADDLRDQCLVHLNGSVCDQPGVFQNPKTAICAELRTIYRGQIDTTVPSMQRVGCTNGTIFPCQGDDDEDAGGSSSGGAGASAPQVSYEIDLTRNAPPPPWDFSQVRCNRRGDCNVSEEFAVSIWVGYQRFVEDGVRVYPARVPCAACEGGVTLGLELRLRHESESVSLSATRPSLLRVLRNRWKPSQSEQLFDVLGLQSGDTITSIAYGPDLDSMSPLQSVAGGTVYDLATERVLSGTFRGVYVVEIINRKGNRVLRTLTVR